MATPTGIVAIVRASRPTFRNRRDRLVFAIHAAVLSEGFHLVGVGEAVDTREEEPLDDTVGEVTLDGWNASDDSYTFRYYNSETKGRLLLKAVAMADKLLISGLSSGDNPGDHVQPQELSVLDYTTESSDYAASYTNIPELLTRLKSSLLKERPRTLPEGNPTQRPTRSRSSLQEGPVRRGDPPPRPALTVGELDAFGNFVHPPNNYGGNMIGPNHPGFVGVGGRGGVPDPRSMIPAGARYDPIGPPGVPGFEPERFQPPRHPMQPGMWPGVHPDLQQMPGQGMGFPGNHPDLPPQRGYDNEDDMFM